MHRDILCPAIWPDVKQPGECKLQTIQVNAELISAAKAYREAFLPKPEEVEELRRQAEEDGPSLFSHMGWFLYQLAEVTTQVSSGLAKGEKIH